MFRSAKVSRVLQNLGEIGNLTAIPAGADVSGVMAFDTGPANMVIEGCMKRLFGREFDRGGAVARTGRVLEDVVARVLGEKYFSALPPKSCGREQFGEGFVSRFVVGHLERAAALARVEFVVAGGGAKNAALMGMLRDEFLPLGVKVRLMEELGVPAQAKEAVLHRLCRGEPH
jgi:anhydro-N-acetylmuramic acid kinase